MWLQPSQDPLLHLTFTARPFRENVNIFLFTLSDPHIKFICYTKHWHKSNHSFISDNGLDTLYMKKALFGPVVYLSHTGRSPYKKGQNIRKKTSRRKKKSFKRIFFYLDFLWVTFIIFLHPLLKINNSSGSRNTV